LKLAKDFADYALSTFLGLLILLSGELPFSENFMLFLDDLNVTIVLVDILVCLPNTSVFWVLFLVTTD